MVPTSAQEGLALCPKRFNPAANCSQPQGDGTFYPLGDLAGAPQELINPHHRNPWRDTPPKRCMASARGRVGAPAPCCLPVNMKMRNPGGRTTASATTTPPWVPTTPKTHSDSPQDSPQPRGMSTTRHSGWMFSGWQVTTKHTMPEKTGSSGKSTEKKFSHKRESTYLIQIK